VGEQVESGTVALFKSEVTAFFTTHIRPAFLTLDMECEKCGLDTGERLETVALAGTPLGRRFREIVGFGSSAGFEPATVRLSI
jgi:hypothetical protein